MRRRRKRKVISLKLDVLSLSDTDSFTVEITASSYNDCGRHLQLVDLYLSLRGLADFSPFLDAPQNRLWGDFRKRLTAPEYEEFVQEIKESRGLAGKWKLEHSVAVFFQAVHLFYVIRSKCYCSLIYLDNGEGNVTTFLKKTMKGGILRARADSLEIGDYFRLGQFENGPILEHDMRKLALYNWSVYFCHQSRYTPSLFCRKKVLVNVQTGLLAPHGFLSDDQVIETRFEERRGVEEESEGDRREGEVAEVEEGVGEGEEGD